jgi:hypothetical protein
MLRSAKALQCPSPLIVKPEMLSWHRLDGPVAFTIWSRYYLSKALLWIQMPVKESNLGQPRENR